MAKMHAQEFDINERLVRALILSQFPEWAHLPLQPVQSYGTDHALFRLGNEYVVRLPRVEWAAGSIDKEWLWVPQISKYLTTPISLPIFKGHPSDLFNWPWLILSWNEGHNPEFEKENEHVQLAADLAHFINQFHKIPVQSGPLSRRGLPLKSQDAETKEAIRQLANEYGAHALFSLWQELSNTPAWKSDPVWVHGDLLPGNIIVNNNLLTAVIDFSDVGVGDPACDLIIAWSLFDAPTRALFREKIICDDDTWQRGKGWALSIALIMLPYYKNTNPLLAALAHRMIENCISLR
jgi:aminoglycoside phosphotransferase (APT) family kinase protein